MLKNHLHANFWSLLRSRPNSSCTSYTQLLKPLENAEMDNRRGGNDGVDEHMPANEKEFQNQSIERWKEFFFVQLSIDEFRWFWGSFILLHDGMWAWMYHLLSRLIPNWINKKKKIKKLKKKIRKKFGKKKNWMKIEEIIQTKMKNKKVETILKGKTSVRVLECLGSPRKFNSGNCFFESAPLLLKQCRHLN